MKSRSSQSEPSKWFRLPSFSARGTSILQGLAVALLLLNLLLVYGIFFSAKGILGYRQQWRQVEEMSARVHKLRAENRRAFHRIQSMKNDQRELEKTVRDQLGWVRENELVFEFALPRQEAR
jgi:cell division protein FtsB